MIRTDIVADPALLDETQCYKCHSILTPPETYTLIESEVALKRDTDDCGGICFACLKKVEKEMYEERRIII